MEFYSSSYKGTSETIEKKLMDNFSEKIQVFNSQGTWLSVSKNLMIVWMRSLIFHQHTEKMDREKNVLHIKTI